MICYHTCGQELVEMMVRDDLIQPWRYAYFPPGTDNDSRNFDIKMAYGVCPRCMKRIDHNETTEKRGEGL